MAPKFYQRKPTRKQTGMIATLAVALAALLGFALIEIGGIVSLEGEDTFSEWVWDLNLGWVIAISVVFAVVAIIAAWAAIHFIEGYVARRRRERS